MGTPLWTWENSTEHSVGTQRKKERKKKKPPQIARRNRYRKTILNTIFFNLSGIVRQWPREEGKSITGKYYRESVLAEDNHFYKRVRSTTGMRGIKLLLDNTHAHAGASRRQELWNFASPSVNPRLCHFLLLLHLKKYLAGWKFNSRWRVHGYLKLKSHGYLKLKLKAINASLFFSFSFLFMSIFWLSPGFKGERSRVTRLTGWRRTQAPLCFVFFCGCGLCVNVFFGAAASWCIEL